MTCESLALETDCHHWMSIMLCGLLELDIFADWHMCEAADNESGCAETTQDML